MGRRLHLGRHARPCRILACIQTIDGIEALQHAQPLRTSSDQPSPAPSGRWAPCKHELQALRVAVLQSQSPSHRGEQQGPRAAAPSRRRWQAPVALPSLCLSCTWLAAEQHASTVEDGWGLRDQPAGLLTLFQLPWVLPPRLAGFCRRHTWHDALHPPLPTAVSHAFSTLPAAVQVIKVGTSSLIRAEQGSLNLSSLASIVETARDLKAQGFNVIIVSR